MVAVQTHSMDLIHEGDGTVLVGHGTQLLQGADGSCINRERDGVRMGKEMLQWLFSNVRS